MIYRIDFSDKSFMIVDDTYTMCLFKNLNSAPTKIGIKTFLKYGHYIYNNYVFIDEPEPGFKIPLSFSISELDKTDLTLNKRYKNSEDIEVGDLVEGPDGPKHVKKLHRGEDEMYELVIDGKSYTVNGGHILHLIDTETKEALDIPVNMYILMNDEFKSHYVMEQIKE